MSFQNTALPSFLRFPQTDAEDAISFLPGLPFEGAADFVACLDAADLADLLEPMFASPGKTMLLQSILEGFSEGVLLLNDRGEWVDGNLQARRICQQLHETNVPASSVPKPIEEIAQLLVDSISLYPGVVVELESEIVLPSSQWIQVHARWLPVEEAGRPLMLFLFTAC